MSYCCISDLFVHSHCIHFSAGKPDGADESPVEQPAKRSASVPAHGVQLRPGSGPGPERGGLIQ